MRLNTKEELSTQCRPCGTINISMYVNNFLSANPNFFLEGGGGGEEGVNSIGK